MTKIKGFFWGMGFAALAYILKNVSEAVLEKSAGNVKNLAKKGKDAMEGMKHKFGEKEDNKPDQITIELDYDEPSTSEDELTQKISKLEKMLTQIQKEINQLKNQ